jgi:glycolate oxidase FAD binding subunit
LNVDPPETRFGINCYHAFNVGGSEFFRRFEIDTKLKFQILFYVKRHRKLPLTMSSDLQFRTDRRPLVAAGQSDLHVRDMTATFSADVSLATVQAELAKIDQWLPIDGAASWTLGQLIETNSTGPLRLGYGAWRDLLLGCQFQNGRGELITAGGRTVKNVAGYDLTKFMIGQRGIFGQLVTITMRTYRRPASAIIARGGHDAHLINRLLPTPCRPQWLVHTCDSTFCGYLGDQRTIEYYRSALREHLSAELTDRPVEEDMQHRSTLWQATGVDGSFRAAVPPAKVLEFATAAGLDDFTADGAFGIVIGITDRSHHDKIRAAAQSLGGSVYFIEEGRAAAQIDPAQRALLQRLKAAFDPEGKLEALT